MPNGFNPFTAPLTMVKQFGEQMSVGIQSLGTGMTQMASQGLDSVITGVPALPGLPGATAAPGMPTPGQLMPANLQQALSQVENLIIPPGMPRPSQVLAAVPTDTKPPPAPAVDQADQPPPAMAQRRRVAERRGL